MIDSSLKVDNQLVRHVAKLAKISIHEDEIDQIRDSMINILEMTQQIEEVKSIKDTTFNTEALSVDDLPEDEVVHGNLIDYMNDHFKQFSQGYFRVPTFVSDD